MPNPVRHVCGISGGKDSSAMASDPNQSSIEHELLELLAIECDDRNMG